MKIHHVLENRRSVRTFDARPVTVVDLEAVLEAARWAPSCGNLQPWRYIVRTSEAARAAMAPCLSRGNQWALAAPVLITLVTRVADGGTSNDIPYAYYDCGLSAMSLVVEAESRGLRAHQMAGWNREPLIALLNLPAGYEPVTVIALGYEGDPARQDSGPREKEAPPRVRRPPGEVRAFDTWPPDWIRG